ncbi:hypothetical protein [Euryhalocaulis caribicus]|uniref:hypothetical protein n=1 Tax=Euryhalocaulis caribicus TaxID=1161401 RepID=UPI001390A401|nr:hypothetical protein [Euryhalocaulis caribicus]
MTLREAIQKDRINEFVNEYKNDPKGDAAALEAILRSMAGSSSEAPKTSSRDGSDH